MRRALHAAARLVGSVPVRAGAGAAAVASACVAYAAAGSATAAAAPSPAAASAAAAGGAGSSDSSTALTAAEALLWALVDGAARGSRGVACEEAGGSMRSRAEAAQHGEGGEGEGEEGEGEEEGGSAAPQLETAPPDFDDLEHSKSFTVHDVNGVNVMLMTALTGKPERDRASVGVQVMMDRGYHTMYIYSDDRDPTITAVYQPGQEGHILRLSGAHRISPAAAVELESTFNPKLVMGHKGTFKYRADDFSASLEARSDQEGKHLDFTYHQAVTPTITAGGSIATTVDSYLPLPTVKAAVPSVFGSVMSGDNTWLWRLSGATGTGSLRLHRQAEKGVELGATLTANAGSLETTAGVGMRMALGSEGGGPGSTLIVNATTDHKVSMSLSTTMFYAFSATQVLAILSATLDHRNQEHLIGAQFQFHY